MLARNAPASILPPLVIGLALVAGGVVTHVALSAVLRVSAADVLLVVIATPGALLIVYALFLVWFFRDPDRVPGAEWVSPADGTVISVHPHEDADVGPGIRVAIFMSPLDVHVNRTPVAGSLLSLEHRPGGYRPAFDKESERNERLVSVWACRDEAAPDGARVKLVQIAGAVARRIVPWVVVGAELQKGERFGMIRLGSRVDIYLPAGVEPLVAAGVRVRAGRSTIAHHVAPRP